MESVNNTIQASTGCVLRRKSDGFVFGQSVVLGMLYNLSDGTILDTPRMEIPEDFEEVESISINSASVYVTPNISDYNTLVIALIRSKYSVDEEFALINNALSDVEHLSENTEYAEYQQWRTACKEAAKLKLGL